MSKTWLVTPAFCKAPLLWDFLDYLYSEGDGHGDVQHIIIDGHYPIDKKNNRKSIREAAAAHGCRLIDSGSDLGLHRGINNAARVMGFQPGDIMVGCDPDDRPSSGFVGAIEQVMNADPSIAVCALGFSVIDQRFREDRGIRQEMIASRRAWVHPTVEMVTVSGYNWTFVDAIGGLTQPHSHYGGLEAALYPKWAMRGMKLVYLPDDRADAKAMDREDRTLFDPEYRAWKTQHVEGYKPGFEQWLIDHGKANLI